MSEKIKVNQTTAGNSLSEVTGSPAAGSKTALDVFMAQGMSIDPLAKYVEAAYSNGNATVTYTFYESSSKATLYTTITVTYTEAQDTSFTSAEWT